MDEIARAILKSVTGGDPYAYQEKIFNDKARFRIINKSRRTGISTILALKALIVALAGKRALIVSNSMKQSGFLMTEYIEPFLRSVPKDLRPVLIEDTKSSKRFANGGYVYSLPNRSDTIRGLNADWILLDEAAHFLHGTDEQVYEAIQPMTALGGGLWMASTPFGDQNLFYRTWMQQQGWEKTTVNWKDCQKLVGAIGDFKSIYDEVTFAQEFENEFRGEAVSEFPMKLVLSCVDPEMSYAIDPVADVAGWDIGRRRDLSSIILRKNDGEVRRAVGKYVWAGMPFEEQQNRALEIASRVGRIYVDQTGMGEGPVEWLMARASNARGILFDNPMKARLIQNMKRLFEQGLVRIPDDPRLINALNAIRRKYSETNYLKYEFERDDELGHMDEAMALALALWDENLQMAVPVGIVQDVEPRRQIFGGNRRW